MKISLLSSHRSFVAQRLKKSKTGGIAFKNIFQIKKTVAQKMIFDDGRLEFLDRLAIKRIYLVSVHQNLPVLFGKGIFVKRFGVNVKLILTERSGFGRYDLFPVSEAVKQTLQTEFGHKRLL